MRLVDFLDMLLWLLRGPVAMFALSVFILGVARIALRHVMVILKALYNTGAEGLPYMALLSRFIRHSAAQAAVFRPRFFPIFKNGCLLTGFLLLPLFSLDHIVVIHRLTGLAYPGFSSGAGTLIALLTLGYIVFRGLAALLARQGGGADTAFWLLMFVLFGSGLLAGVLNHPAILKSVQALHALSGAALLVLVPFLPVRNYLIAPLVFVTRHLGTWALPARTERNETLEYFKTLKPGK